MRTEEISAAQADPRQQDQQPQEEKEQSPQEPEQPAKKPAFETPVLFQLAFPILLEDFLQFHELMSAGALRQQRLRAFVLGGFEVAISVGFFDQFYFSRVFKRAMGMPPSRYIAAQQAEAAPAETLPADSAQPQ